MSGVLTACLYGHGSPVCRIVGAMIACLCHHDSLGLKPVASLAYAHVGMTRQDGRLSQSRFGDFSMIVIC